MPFSFSKEKVSAKDIVLEDLLFTNFSGFSGKSIMSTLNRLLKKLPAKQWERIESIRPWRLFFDCKQFSVPDMMAATKRLGVNLFYFSSNYLIISMVIALYQIIAHPSLLFAIVGCAAFAIYYRALTLSGHRILLNGNQLPDSQVYGFFSGTAVFLFWITGGTSAVFGTLSLCVLSITAHSMLRDITDIEKLIGSFHSDVEYA